MAELYTYAVARIRAKEPSLLSKQDMDQMLSCKDSGEVIRILTDKGFGDGINFDTVDELLLYETEKTWKLIGELVDDMSVFDVFLYANDFHNLKAAVKAVITDAPTDKLFLKNATVSPDEILKAVKERDYSYLPPHMRTTAAQAVSLLLQTSDGQLCDILIDKASLTAIRTAGRQSKNDMIDKYSELVVALADIKIAVRANKTGKSAAFLEQAIASCDTLNTASLITAATKSIGELYDYLALTDYREAVSHLKVSFSAFEKWCDNLIMEHIKGQKSNPFTVSPLAAYILARENEIKAVRIILSAKQNGLSDNSVRERLRELYV